MTTNDLAALLNMDALLDRSEESESESNDSDSIPEVEQAEGDWNREGWLTGLKDSLTTIFEALGNPLPDNIRISCGFPRGSRGRSAIGQTITPDFSESGHWEIFISPVIGDAKEAACTLVHELMHVAVGLDCGHRGDFLFLARRMGFDGPVAAPRFDKGFGELVEPVLKALGRYPHARINFAKQTTAETYDDSEVSESGESGDVASRRYTTVRRSTGSWNLKAQCKTCGMIARVTRKWVDICGAPYCGILEHGRMIVD